MLSSVETICMFYIKGTLKFKCPVPSTVVLTVQISDCYACGTRSVIGVATDFSQQQMTSKTNEILTV
jgi:hypothetical protein